MDMKWKNIRNEKPLGSKYGTAVLVMLNNGQRRVHGEVVISIYYKRRFHRASYKGPLQNVTYWMELPKPLV